GAFTVARPKLLANAAGLLQIAVVAGMGIALMARSLMRTELASGRLVPVLEREVGQVVPVSLVYAAGAQLSPKVRSFVDFAAAWTEKLDVEAIDATGMASSRAGAST